MALAFDHLLRAVPDLDAAGERLLDEHGLAALSGGRHDGHGTANRIVPLGPDYLELISVVDPQEAAGSPVGRWIQRGLDRGGGLWGVNLRTEDADRIPAAREKSAAAAPIRLAEPPAASISAAMSSTSRATAYGWVSPLSPRPRRSYV